jgi:hypothetical protein
MNTAEGLDACTALEGWVRTGVRPYYSSLDPGGPTGPPGLLAAPVVLPHHTSHT